ncbi:unnamed protein product, partial [Ilex paraguariensis]
GYYKLAHSLSSDLPGVAHASSLSKIGISAESEGMPCQDEFFNSGQCADRSVNLDSSNGR